MSIATWALDTDMNTPFDKHSVHITCNYRIVLALFARKALSSIKYHYLSRKHADTTVRHLTQINLHMIKHF